MDTPKRRGRKKGAVPVMKFLSGRCLLGAVATSQSGRSQSVPPVAHLLDSFSGFIAPPKSLNGVSLIPSPIAAPAAP